MYLRTVCDFDRPQPHTLYIATTGTDDVSAVSTRVRMHRGARGTSKFELNCCTTMAAYSTHEKTEHTSAYPNFLIKRRTHFNPQIEKRWTNNWPVNRIPLKRNNLR